MRKLMFLSALCVGLSGISHADSTFFLVNNTYGTVSPAGTLIAVTGSATGSVNIDTSAGIVDSVDIKVTEAGTDYLFTGAPVTQSVDASGTMYFEYSFDGAQGDVLLLDFPTTSLVGYGGGNLCTLDTLCPDGQGNVFAGYFGLADGTFFAAATGSLAPTPEPSSVVLLGTGLLATVGAARRRLFSPRI